MSGPLIIGDNTGTVTEGTGVAATGDLDDQIDNGDDLWFIADAATFGTASVDASTGEWSYTVDDTDPAVQALDPGDTLTDTFVVQANDADGDIDVETVTITIEGAVCFAADTLVETETGLRPIETLAPGDRIRTLDRGPVDLRWIGAMPVSTAEMEANPRLAPVRIRAGALGPGLPKRDLRVSRQHRILVCGPQARAAFGTTEALVPAINLVPLPGVTVEGTPRAVVYYHLLFDRHEVVLSEGAPTESLLPTARGLQGLPASARDDVLTRLPHLARTENVPTPARRIVQRGRDLRPFLAALTRDGAKPLSSFTDTDAAAAHGQGCPDIAKTALAG
jgi:VCBS repeat-containing protein